MRPGVIPAAILLTAVAALAVFAQRFGGGRFGGGIRHGMRGARQARDPEKRYQD